MAEDNASDPVAEEVIRLLCQQKVHQELIATLIAELAMLDPEPRNRLEQIVSNEEGAAFEALGATNIEQPGQMRVQQEKERARIELFDFARQILVRLQATR